MGLTKLSMNHAVVDVLESHNAMADLVPRAKSYNLMYDPFDIPQTGEFEVFGRVVKAWKGEEL